MKQLLCRNRVEDFQRWREIFDSHDEGQRASGLQLVRLWREDTDPNNVFFLFDVVDEALARAFLEAPESAEAGEISGVLDGEFHFVSEMAEYHDRDL